MRKRDRDIKRRLGPITMPKCIAAALLLFLLCASTEALALSGAIADKEDRYPYVVAIQYRQRLICSGTVLYPRIVVTAAHCVERELDPRRNVFADEYLRSSRLTVVAMRNGKPQSYAVAETIASPVWRKLVSQPTAGQRYAYDLALIITKMPIDVPSPPSLQSLADDWPVQTEDRPDAVRADVMADNMQVWRDIQAEALTHKGVLVGFGASDCVTLTRCGSMGVRRYRPIGVRDTVECFNAALEAEGKGANQPIEASVAAVLPLAVWCTDFGVMPGDSGGALLIEGPGGKLYYLGVISSHWGSYAEKATKREVDRRSFATALYPSLDLIFEQARKLGYDP
jgi:hypothetical protein